MLTAKENLRQSILPDGKPDRFSNNYEGMYLMMHPWIMHSGALLMPGDYGKVNAWGVTMDFPEYVPGAFPVHKPETIVCKDIETWFDYVKAPSLDFPEAEWEVFQQQYEEINATGKAYAAPIYVTGLFEMTHYLCAIDDALVYYLTEEESMKDMIKYLTEFELKVAEGICEHLHPEMLFHHDDWGTENNSFLRPEVFADFFVEPYKEVYGYYKDHGVEFIVHHNDSYSANLVPYMIEMGIDVWQGAMANNDTRGILEQYDHKLAIMGDIDNKFIDFDGWTPEDVKRVAYEHLDGFTPNGYIPCITQGGPGSTFSGTYVELMKYIDQYNTEKFGFTQQELEDARLEPQILFG
ncbi:MAG: uroporphyrinogen decarboxylase [Eggerthellaceae bacterium]|nr:uroporphyrinogen decarboxylase [Eggerthellaceae bacterium]